MRAHLLLGVDVGNSKTEVAVATAAGDVLAIVSGPGASPQVLGPRGTWEVVGGLTADALGRAGPAGRAPVRAAAYAVAGLDLEADQAAFEAAAPPSPAQAVGVWNDVFAVLRAGTAGDGIAVVAGAGMNCVGRRGARMVRYPALGLLSGDWGGGIALGAEALAAACRSQDGRGPRTDLERTVPAFFDLRRPEQVTLAVHRGELDRGALTALAKLVLAGADAGDGVCAALVQRQADEVAALVEATARRLGASSGDLPVVLGGGLLQAGCRSLDAGVAAALARLDPPARASALTCRPVVGAVLLAADLTRVQDQLSRTTA